MTTNGKPLELGRWRPNRNALFRGTIDDVRLYDRRLTSKEVQAIFRDLSNEMAPPAPMELTARSDSMEAIRLTWTHDPKGLEVAGFLIERKDANSNGRFVALAELEGGERDFEDRQLKPATAHVYRLRAFGSGGFSSCSNEAGALTMVDPTEPPPEPPLGWWKLDEASGEEAKDDGVGGHDGRLEGIPEWTAGYLDGGLALDGEGD
jgi:hypothetical protein